MVVRFPWKTFAPVTTLTHGAKLTAHPNYHIATEGDLKAARSIVAELVGKIPIQLPKSDFIAPVLHLEGGKKWNALPLAFAEYVAKRTGAKLRISVVQTNILPPYADASVQQLLSQPTFEGRVKAGTYTVVTDMIQLGSAIANLRGLLLSKGAHVAGAASITFASSNNELAPEPFLLKLLLRKHGSRIGILKDTLGFDPECLTQREAHFVLGLANLAVLGDSALPSHRISVGSR